MASTMARTTTRLVLAALCLGSVVYAVGDFPCDGATASQSCAEWSVDPRAQGTISSTAICAPDPVNPAISYCGYSGTACTTHEDCDYGSCGKDGRCKGYLGDPCPNGDHDCQAFFFCGTDGTCGGVGAGCNNGDDSSPIPKPDQQCASNSCNQANKTCNALPDDGMPLGAGCAVDAVCASGYCSSGNICRLPPSNGIQAKAKRDL